MCVGVDTRRSYCVGVTRWMSGAYMWLYRARCTARASESAALGSAKSSKRKSARRSSALPPIIFHLTSESLPALSLAYCEDVDYQYSCM